MMQYLARLGGLGAASQQDLIWFASIEIGLCVGIVVLRIRASTTSGVQKRGKWKTARAKWAAVAFLAWRFCMTCGLYISRKHTRYV